MTTTTTIADLRHRWRAAWLVRCADRPYAARRWDHPPSSPRAQWGALLWDEEHALRAIERAGRLVSHRHATPEARAAGGATSARSAGEGGAAGGDAGGERRRPWPRCRRALCGTGGARR